MKGAGAQEYNEHIIGVLIEMWNKGECDRVVDFIATAPDNLPRVLEDGILLRLSELSGADFVAQLSKHRGATGV